MSATDCICPAQLLRDLSQFDPLLLSLSRQHHHLKLSQTDRDVTLPLACRRAHAHPAHHKPHIPHPTPAPACAPDSVFDVVYNHIIPSAPPVNSTSVSGTVTCDVTLASPP